MKLYLNPSFLDILICVGSRWRMIGVFGVLEKITRDWEVLECFQ